ncbi:MAG: Asp-tRNA(Asn)/Glu-tRNA(Gln) amidotransferase subunit GatA [Gammaproteobacteria bacterium]|nr:Asp-tRNA(Asn)/Glu-tRNA(Gln) amidotransferase subunit GatA [Gammaproteobacteria bacterium]
MKSLRELGAALAAGETTSVALTEEALTRIAGRDQALNSFITLAHDEAMAEARAADAAITRGEVGPLAGIPMAHKDLFCTTGVKSSAGSRMLDNFVAPHDATVVENLRRARAVMVGKTNMDEFAMGSSNETSFYGAVKNPWNTDCVPGGSSGGSAAAVAARLVPYATGTDTGGSIRQPAALAGITGLKPTYGRVSRYGIVAFASSLDQAGTLTVSAEDAAQVLRAMAGFDKRDSTSVDEPVPDYPALIEESVKGKRAGIPKEFLAEGVTPGVRDAFTRAAEELTKLGCEVEETTLPNLRYSVPVYYVVAPAEASSNLARYDGVRYGHRADNPANLEDLYLRSRGEGFGTEVKRRILIGTFVLSHGYFDAYYLRAQRVRQLIADDFREAFGKYDFLLGPTTPTAAFKIGEKTSDPVAMYLNDIFTIGVNLAGLPAVSVPMGFDGGLPVGLQIIGRAFDEGGILALAHQYQQATDWHRQTPPGVEA